MTRRAAKKIEVSRVPAADMVIVAGFQDLEADTIELAFTAEAADFIAEKLLIDHPSQMDQGTEFVRFTANSARMLAFMVAQTCRRARALEEKWTAAHNRSCDIERQALYPDIKP